MGRLIAAVRCAESTAAAAATLKWSAMIAIVSECRSIRSELLAENGVSCTDQARPARGPKGVETINGWAPPDRTESDLT